MRTDDLGDAGPQPFDIPSAMANALKLLAQPAVISEDERHRFWLLRELRATAPKDLCVFMMLNPSTADASQDDPTIRRCKGFARRWGFLRLGVVNLYSLRATDPKELKRWDYEADSDHLLRNQTYVTVAAALAELVVVAWGTSGADVLAPIAKLPATVQPFCLGKTSKGAPKHPLYVPNVAKLVPWP